MYFQKRNFVSFYGRFDIIINFLDFPLFRNAHNFPIDFSLTPRRSSVAFFNQLFIFTNFEKSREHFLFISYLIDTPKSNRSTTGPRRFSQEVVELRLFSLPCFPHSANSAPPIPPDARPNPTPPHYRHRHFFRRSYACFCCFAPRFPDPTRKTAEFLIFSSESPQKNLPPPKIPPISPAPSHAIMAVN